MYFPGGIWLRQRLVQGTLGFWVCREKRCDVRVQLMVLGDRGLLSLRFHDGEGKNQQLGIAAVSKTYLNFPSSGIPPCFEVVIRALALVPAITPCQ